MKILDSGIAKRKREISHSVITKQGTLVGTLQYMSPEQAMGLAIDERTDLWSTGATVFRALAGRVPFPGPDAKTLPSPRGGALSSRRVYEPWPGEARACGGRPPSSVRGGTTVDAGRR